MSWCCVLSSCCASIPILILLALILVLHKLRLFSKLLYSVDKESTRCGGELVAEVLKQHKVDFVFTLCGGHISPILVNCEKRGIRVIDTRHEVAAVFAADAVARLSGKIGVACVTAGPGLTNTVTAIKNAQMAESAVLLLGGASAGILKNRGSLQDIDQMALFKPICKHTVTITAIRDIIPCLCKAIQIAQSGTPGPVFVEFPIDTLYSFNLVSREIGVKDGPKGLMAQITKFFIDSYIHNLFGNAFMEKDTRPLPVDIPLPSAAQISECADLIFKAKKPVMILGSQVVLPPVPATETQKSLETIGIPCFLGGMSRGILGKDSNLQVRQRRKDALKDADLVILVGTVCDFRLNYGRVLNRRSKIVAINRCKEQLYRNSDMFWKPTLPIIADVGTTLQLVAKGLNGYKPPQDWLETLRSRDLEVEVGNKKKADAPGLDNKLNPLTVLYSLENCLSDNTILVADGGDFVGSAAYILRPRGPLTWLDPGAFGTLGVGGGFALGAKLCRPDCDVVVIWGDGSVGYSVSEYDTFTRHKVPIIGVVGNDACWSQISREQVPLFGSNIGCELAYCDYDKVVAGYGAHGIKMTVSDLPAMDSVFNTALAKTREGKPVLVNCIIGKSDFREGSISV